MLILLSPLFLLISILIIIKGESTVFFRQERPGLYARIFRVYKFKTMTDEKDIQGNLLPEQMRITKTGNFIRKSSLDEIPQLINVLKGEMSFIGPRPLMPRYIYLYSKKQYRRHEVRPGITGLAQINGRNAISWQKKFEYDIYYVENISFILDLKILILTARKVILREGISKEGYATTEAFNGHN